MNVMEFLALRWRKIKVYHLPRKLKITLYLLTAFGILWGGCYTWQFIPDDSWFSLPVFVTLLVAFVWMVIEAIDTY